MRAWRTSAVRRFWTNATTPEWAGTALGSRGSARRSAILPPENAIGPTHSKTTQLERRFGLLGTVEQLGLHNRQERIPQSGLEAEGDVRPGITPRTR